MFLMLSLTKTRIIPWMSMTNKALLAFILESQIKMICNYDNVLVRTSLRQPNRCPDRSFAWECGKNMWIVMVKLE